MKRGKNYRDRLTHIELGQLYSPVEAVKKLRDVAYAKFDETVEMHVNLGIDPRHADQQLRGTLELPAGTGRTVRVIVIADGADETAAKEAGADEVGADELIGRIEKGWFDFDIVLAVPRLMAKVGRLGRVLGSRGLMPNPKSGTVTTDVAGAVKAFKGGRLEYRNDKAGLVHLGIGKMSFSDEALLSNFKAVYEVLEKVKPSKAKGVYFKGITLCSAMSMGVPVEASKVKWREENG